MSENAGRIETAGGEPRRERRDGEDNLKSLAKVGRVLDCFSTSRRALSLAEISAQTGLPRSTVHRLLASMREVGFIEQERERDQYRLGLRLFELGSIVLSNLELNSEGRSIVESLHRLTGRTVHLAIFDGLRAVVVQRVETGGELSLPSTFVENSPIHCTSVGKAILAYQEEEAVARVVAAGLERFTEATITDESVLAEELRQIRARGYAVDNGEHQPGLRCVGAPIRDQGGRVFAAISISSPAWQLPEAEVEEVSKIVTYHANLLSKRLDGMR
jgi:DNA-binding IclR family transcriptional regulator